MLAQQHGSARRWDAHRHRASASLEPLRLSPSLPLTPRHDTRSNPGRLDSLAGLFAVGCVPTASADPYALRRTAVGLLSTLRSHGARLDLRELLGEAARQLPLPAEDAAATQAAAQFVIRRAFEGAVGRRRARGPCIDCAERQGPVWAGRMLQRSLAPSVLPLGIVGPACVRVGPAGSPRTTSTVSNQTHRRLEQVLLDEGQPPEAVRAVLGPRGFDPVLASNTAQELAVRGDRGWDCSLEWAGAP